MFKKIFIATIFCIASMGINTSVLAESSNSLNQKTDVQDMKELLGRWDLTVDMNGSSAPSWLEVEISGNRTLVGSFVGAGGSARPISKINFEDGKFNFSIPPQWESGDGDFVIEGQVSGDALTGTITTNSGQKFSYKGVRAPYLDSTKKVKWGKQIHLFNGKDLKGWTTNGKRENQWVVKDGILTSPKPGANLISEEKFNDFKLTVEFKYPEHGNSGIYLRGRYEVQIFDFPEDEHPDSHGFAGVYGFLSPNENVVKGPGEWQTFEITLIGRLVTIVANGKTVICEQEIPGITGGALDSNEGEPGPIYIQGDHTSVEFRKIDIVPAE